MMIDDEELLRIRGNVARADAREDLASEDKADELLRIRANVARAQARDDARDELDAERTDEWTEAAREAALEARKRNASGPGSHIAADGKKHIHVIVDQHDKRYGVAAYSVGYSHAFGDHYQNFVAKAPPGTKPEALHAEIHRQYPAETHHVTIEHIARKAWIKRETPHFPNGVSAFRNDAEDELAVEIVRARAREDAAVELAELVSLDDHGEEVRDDEWSDAAREAAIEARKRNAKGGGGGDSGGDGGGGSGASGSSKPVTATDTNVYALGRLANGRSEFPNKIERATAPHIRRAMKAGLVEVKDKHTLRLTDAGKRALNVKDSSAADAASKLANDASASARNTPSHAAAAELHRAAAKENDKFGNLRAMREHEAAATSHDAEVASGHATTAKGSASELNAADRAASDAHNKAATAHLHLGGHDKQVAYHRGESGYHQRQIGHRNGTIKVHEGETSG